MEVNAPKTDGAAYDVRLAHGINLAVQASEPHGSHRRFF